MMMDIFPFTILCEVPNIDTLAVEHMILTSDI